MTASDADNLATLVSGDLQRVLRSIAQSARKVFSCDSVVLWSQQESTALTSAVRACVGAGARVVVGGPGGDEVLLPDRVMRVTSLVDATDRLA